MKRHLQVEAKETSNEKEAQVHMIWAENGKSWWGWEDDGPMKQLIHMQK